MCGSPVICSTTNNHILYFKVTQHHRYQMAAKELNFITGNENKLMEVQAILRHVVTVKSQPLDLVEIQGTIEEISIDKCQRAAELVRASPKIPGNAKIKSNLIDQRSGTN